MSSPKIFSQNAPLVVVANYQLLERLCYFKVSVLVLNSKDDEFLKIDCLNHLVIDREACINNVPKNLTAYYNIQLSEENKDS